MIIRLFKRILIKLPRYQNIYNLHRKIFPKPFDSSSFWEKRYISGGNSGKGSYGRLKVFKNEVINDFVESKNVASIIEFGVGDGNQLLNSRYPCYLGVDVSEKAINICRKKFAGDQSKSFIHSSNYNYEKADLSISLDVIYHLVEDSVFNSYMRKLFEAANKYVIIYSSNNDQVHDSPLHIKHRKFTNWVNDYAVNFRLLKFIKNRYPLKTDQSKESFADFYIYELSN